MLDDSGAAATPPRRPLDGRGRDLRVAVVTPYFRVPDHWLRQCHESVRAQDYPCTHILVADGAPQDIVEQFDAQHIVLPTRHADFGDTPRAVGSLAAIEQGFDAIAYLDADNWYRANHIASLVALHRQTGAAICTSKRSVHHLDGRLMAVCLTSDGERFCDTNCLMLTRAGFSLAPLWGELADDEHVLDDRVIWQHALSSGLSRAHSSLPTVGYRATNANFYWMLEWPLPDGVRSARALCEANSRWVASGKPQLDWEYFLDATALTNRGLARLAAGLPAAALGDFDAILEFRPDDGEAHHLRGAALLALKRHAEALASFERALARQPDNARCHHNRGVSLGALGRHVEALASFERALALQPDDPLARRNRDAARRAVAGDDAAVAGRRFAKRDAAGRPNLYEQAAR